MKVLLGKNTKRSLLVKDKNGVNIGDEQGRLNRWAEYFHDLLNGEEPSTPLSDDLVPISEFDLDIDLSDPSVAEVKLCINRLKLRKAPGFDSITPEMLKCGGENLINWLTRVCVAVWRSEQPPDDWKKGVIIKLAKKGDLTICSNNRGITLLSVAGKVFCSVILYRLRDAVDKTLREQQAGFRAGRSCTDQCFSLRQVIEKCLDKQIPLKLNFVDFKAAFDSVHRNSLWKIMRAYGVPQKIVTIMKNTYAGSECCVRVDGQETNWFQVNTGVRQGCIWSPLLFSIVIDWVLKSSLDEKDMGMVIERRRSSRYQQQRLADLDFADDIALMDNDADRLQLATDSVSEFRETVGLKIRLFHNEVSK